MKKRNPSPVKFVDIGRQKEICIFALDIVSIFVIVCFLSTMLRHLKALYDFLRTSSGLENGSMSLLGQYLKRD